VFTIKIDHCITQFGSESFRSKTKQDVDVDGVYERRPNPLCPHLEITSRYGKLRY